MDPISISAILGVGESIIERIWPDASEQEKRKLELARIAQQGDLSKLQAHVKSLTGQLEINKAEAQHKSIFVAGWRPAVGWVCAAGLAWNFILQPILTWVAFLFEVDIGKAPKLDITELITILLGMLGLGTMRMNEKVKGVASDSMKNSR